VLSVLYGSYDPHYDLKPEEKDKHEEDVLTFLRTFSDVELQDMVTVQASWAETWWWCGVASNPIRRLSCACFYPRHLRVSTILSIASYSFDINVMSFYHSYIGRSFHNLARRHGPYENQAHFNDRY
jgi:hypothetical protein